MINRGLSFSMTVVGHSPAFSRTPGRKGSIMTSTCGRRDFTKEIPSADLMSTAMEVLRRERTSGVGGGRVGEWVWGVALSRRRTEAP